MIRFMAAAWNPADPNAASDAEWLKSRHRLSSGLWTTVLDASGLFVSSHDRTPAVDRWVLPDNCGALIGTVFGLSHARTACRHQGLLPAPCLAELLASEGRNLLQRMWGFTSSFLEMPVDPACGSCAAPWVCFPVSIRDGEGLSCSFLQLKTCAACE